MPRSRRCHQGQPGNPQDLRPGAGSQVMISRALRLPNPVCFMSKIAFLFSLLIASLSSPDQVGAANNKPASPLAAWEHSIVNVEVARKQYDYYQPWSKRTRKTLKTGTVMSDHQILTT